MSVYEHLKWKTKSNILNEAVEFDNYELVKKILEDMNLDNRTKKLALSIALKKGLYKISELLLDNIDEDINIKYTEDYNTNLLKNAVSSGKDSLITLLIDKGIDVKDNFDALNEALDNSDTTILNLLLANGANVKKNPWLFNTVYKDKNYEAIKLLIEYGGDPKFHDNVYLWYRVCEVLKKLGKEVDDEEIFNIIHDEEDKETLLLDRILEE